MDSPTTAFEMAQRELRAQETVAAPNMIDEAFAMQTRPSTIETWLGDNHAAGE
jgi:hypothetical protein